MNKELINTIFVCMTTVAIFILTCNTIQTDARLDVIEEAIQMGLSK